MDCARRACLVVPFRNEARHLPDVLASLRAQRLERVRVRYVFVDSASVDGGARIVEEWLRGTGADGEVLRLDRPGIAVALNAAIGRAQKDEIVVRLDAHTRYDPSYVRSLVDALDQLPSSVWWVGGSQSEPDAPGFGGALVRALMTNPMGLGGSDMRRTAGDLRRIDGNPYLGAFRPGILQSLGGFDERWTANEDSELAARIERAGGEIWHVPAPCTYLITRGPWQTALLWHKYGTWRARTIRRHPGTLRLRHVAPPAAVVLGVALACSPARVLLLPLAAVFAALVSARRRRGEALAVTAASVAYFPLVHAAFGTGLLRGWCSPVRSAGAPAPLSGLDAEAAPAP